MSSEPTDPTVILLAAGKGKRFGELKQLVKVRGKPLIQWPMETIMDFSWTYDPMLVLGYRAEMIKERVDTSDFRVLENGKWEEGMSSSLKLGVRSAEAGTSGYLLLLGDMPLVPPAAIERVVKKGKAGSSIVAPSYRGQRGFPVFLDGPWKDELLEEISGDRGARRILEKNPEVVTLIETEHRGVVMDVDEQSDLVEVESLLKEEGKNSGI